MNFDVSDLHAAVARVNGFKYLGSVLHLWKDNIFPIVVLELVVHVVTRLVPKPDRPNHQYVLLLVDLR